MAALASKADMASKGIYGPKRKFGLFGAMSDMRTLRPGAVGPLNVRSWRRNGHYLEVADFREAPKDDIAAAAPAIAIAI